MHLKISPWLDDKKTPSKLCLWADMTYYHGTDPADFFYKSTFYDMFVRFLLVRDVVQIFNRDTPTNLFMAHDMRPE